MRKKFFTLKYILNLFIGIFLIQNACGNGSNELNGSKMIFWEIIVDNDEKTTISPDYEYGESRFPNYLAYKLPKHFIIKKSPDLIIDGDKIEEIIIKNERKKSTTPLYVATIKFKPDMRSIIKEYTNKNRNKVILIEIDNDILSVNMIMDEVVDESKIYLMSDFKKAKLLLEKLKCKIKVIES
jgi:preprotein translocase subunit SecD